MPAHRLPWIKFWPEAWEHEKVALLSDGAFRTWMGLLSKGSLQPTRWRFASAQHAAIVCGRSVDEVRELIAARLLDEREDGLWVFNFESENPMRKRWQALRRKLAPLIFARDGFRCRRCGATERLEVDHIVPIVLGGDNDTNNLQTLCLPCNRRKGAN